MQEHINRRPYCMPDSNFLQLQGWNLCSQLNGMSDFVRYCVLGFSDPYCMLGIMPLRRMPSLDYTESSSLGSSDEENNPRARDKDKGAFKRFSTKKKSTSAAIRDQLPAKYIQTTSVIPNTLNPVWNERFRLWVTTCTKHGLNHVTFSTFV